MNRRPLTPIMRAVLEAVRDIEADARSQATRRGDRRFVWLGADPSVIATHAARALRLDKRHSSFVSSPLGGLVERGLLVTSLGYARAGSRLTTRYLLTPRGRQVAERRPAT